MVPFISFSQQGIWRVKLVKVQASSLVQVPSISPESNFISSLEEARHSSLFKFQAPQNLDSPWMGTIVFLILRRGVNCPRSHACKSWNKIENSLTPEPKVLGTGGDDDWERARVANGGAAENQRSSPCERLTRAGWGRRGSPRRGSPPLPPLPLLLFRAAESEPRCSPGGRPDRPLPLGCPRRAPGSDPRTFQEGETWRRSGRT